MAASTAPVVPAGMRAVATATEQLALSQQRIHDANLIFATIRNLTARSVLFLRAVEKVPWPTWPIVTLGDLRQLGKPAATRLR